jgi:hypothetical protein
MKIAGYTLQVPNSATLLLFVAGLFVLVLLTVWLRYGGQHFRQFIYETFTDAAGRPDSKLLTAFLFSDIYVFLMLRGALFGTWPPEYVNNTILLFIASLLGLDVWNTTIKTKVEANKPKEDERNNPSI